ncbi:hypothetical protein AcW1_009123 [Taiwanofungus camphoratus]|nr:hypothetical protein AcV5_007146 [Antrodia cinnamomea]KAI0930428.1 hypothetical protein AcV5_007146 [Antrodia cinnamomea]KAI0949537.1 hypothetical protein AcW1_009123 [Antrodia cinnamomea]
MSSAISLPIIFSNLPTELLRDIFEHAAQSDPATARKLTLVSSAVRHWTDPILYNTVILSSAKSLRSFLAAIAKKPSDFVRTRVKHLGIFALGPVQTIDRILNACRGVQSLACGFHLPGYKQMLGCGTLQALKGSREQHLLGLSCRDGWDTALVGPSVTHLRIHVTSYNTGHPDAPLGLALGADESGWDHLEGLSALTHLAIVYRCSASIPPTSILSALRRLLSLPQTASANANPPRLELILVQVLGSIRYTSQTDPVVHAINCAAVAAGGPALRIVAESAPGSVVRQWEKAARGGPGVWEGAERVVKSRLAADK